MTAVLSTRSAGSSTIAPPRILVFADRFLPGFKAGGAIRTLANIVEQLGNEFHFNIVTRDRDSGDDKPYSDVKSNTWVPFGKAKVMYLSPGRRAPHEVRRIIADSECDLLYLNSFFSPVFTLQPLILRRVGLLPPIPVIVAPRGEFSPGALQLKSTKKQPFLRVAKATRLYRSVIWQASTTFEETDIRRWFGTSAHVIVASDLTSSPCPIKRELEPKIRGQLKIVFLSRISRKKNLLLALRLLANLRGNIEFNIYGPIAEFDYWRECEAVIAVLPPNVRVKYRGAVAHDNVLNALGSHHLFFMPTLGENFGHAIFEALSAGLPVLTSDQTPWRNLEEKKAGWDLSLDRWDLYERALAHCIEMDSNEYLAWSSAARKLGTEFLAQDSIRSTTDLFRSALSLNRFNSSRE